MAFNSEGLPVLRDARVRRKLSRQFSLLITAIQATRAGRADREVSGMRSPVSRLLVVMDPHFGVRLQAAWTNQPVWAVMSPVNEPVIRALWAAHPQPNHLVGLTGFSVDASATAEDQFLDELDIIDLHHGPYSSATSYTELEVIGCRLTAPVHEALTQLGFSQFNSERDGFTATRSREEAATLRS